MKRIIPVAILCMALAACRGFQVRTPESVGTVMPPANMPNPASVFCEQNGNTLEIRTGADGSQTGVCVFLDGSTCDEWTYYRGTCGPAEPFSPTPAMTGEAAPEANAGDPGANASGGYMPPGTSEEIVDWWGIIQSSEPGSPYDDYFTRQDLGQIIYFGIASSDSDVQAQIAALRDSGQIVHLYGTLFSNVPDYNGSQILVDRLEVEG